VSNGISSGILLNLMLYLSVFITEVNNEDLKRR
jgi:hypothetical protein